VQRYRRRGPSYSNATAAAAVDIGGGAFIFL